MRGRTGRWLLALLVAVLVVAAATYVWDSPESKSVLLTDQENANVSLAFWIAAGTGAATGLVAALCGMRPLVLLPILALAVVVHAGVWLGRQLQFEPPVSDDTRGAVVAGALVFGFVALLFIATATALGAGAGAGVGIALRRLGRRAVGANPRASHPRK